MMRVRYITPVVLGFFVALACAGKNGSTVEAGGGSGNINTGMGGGLVVGTGGGAATGNSANGTGMGDTFDPDAACATSAADGQPVPVDLYFMVDITGSMHCPVPDTAQCDVEPPMPWSMTTRWTVESAALKAFMDDKANSGISVGIRFFPTNNNICSAASYVRPAVEIAALPGAAMNLDQVIDMQMPGGQTPTVPALDGAIQHAQAWAQAHPTHRVAVVYSTDGYPMGCPNNTIDNAATLAAAAFAAKPSIPTYVLGVGPNLTDLNKIATAGGTQAAFLIDTKADAAAQLAQALASIRTTAVLGCTYTIPAPPSGQTLQPGLVNVTYTSSKGAVTKVTQDPAGTTCAKGNGWEYSTDGTQINLCGGVCDAVKADPGGKLQVLFGCATEVGMPPK
ncbi:MAG TPA: vWA domain-containing protein [Polyangiaceae bacterium]